MVTRVTPAGTQVTGTKIPTTFGNGVAGGWLGDIADVTGQGSITAEASLTGLTVTVLANPSRKLLITAKVKAQSTVANDSAVYRIKEGGTILDSIDFTFNAAGGPGAVGLQFSAIVTPSSGNHTYNVTLARTSGTGTLSHIASTTVRSWLLVMDIGPA